MAIAEWHALTAAEAVAKLESTASGLTAVEAARRLGMYGPNRIEAERRASPWKLLFQQFKNVLILTLLLATVLSAFLGHGLEALAIAVIVLFAVLLGFVQEFKAEKALEALREMAAPLARVKRDGKEEVINATELVPGDLLLFSAGDRVAADARLIHALNLRSEESSLTGESLPSEKAQYGFVQSLPIGASKAWNLFSDNAKGIGKVMSGQVKAGKAFTGPIGIYSSTGCRHVPELVRLTKCIIIRPD